MNTEVGAGTLNPATFLRVLGPEPWRVCYVEPSVRPDDARYGENPNRIQTHTQFQVILKPEPGNPQELYLGSLRAVGVDVAAHDVRFVEDNWASPALGAWGLGWEVWLDGLEITQFTYFQQAGGISLDPPSVELTYGMERIMMALQGVNHFKDITYSTDVSYGEVFGQAEYEMSRYYLDDADIATNQALFDAYEAEAQRMIDARLPVPAHVYVLKCSHAFNVLDSRGAVSTTERAKAFARMRGRRKEEGYPLGVVEPLAPPALPEVGTVPKGMATLALEIGVEEMPPHEVGSATAAVKQALVDRLATTRLEHGNVRAFATPRRVLALVDAVAPREEDHQQFVRGPKAQAAFGPDGEPTKAAAGFARGQGVDVAVLERVAVDGTQYVGVTQHVPGRSAHDVLAELLPAVVAGLHAEKNMRWNAPGLSFTRPIRWVLALLGDSVVPFTVSSITSGRTTYVHRTAALPQVSVQSADGFLDLLAEHGIVTDATDRRRRIIESASTLAAEVNGQIDAVGESALVDEITNLVEQPNALRGGFNPKYLDLPADILTTVMRKHQRYLPIRGTAGTLLPHFVAVANGDCSPDLVRAGNEAVLRARYEDAAFFWRADLQIHLQDLKLKLAKLTFADKLGSMGDRATRIATIGAELTHLIDLDNTDLATMQRAAALAKFDLASRMVIELPSLAGVMAREYALRAGEPEPVATALYEMEQPRTAGGALPQTGPGSLLALADRFDLLTGLFAVGAAPTGSSDPYAMRRAALGIVAILRAHPHLAQITIPAGLGAAARVQPVEVPTNALADAESFIAGRLEQQLLDAGHPHDHVKAVMLHARSPAMAGADIAELARLTNDPAFAALSAAIQRVSRIVPPGAEPDFDTTLLTEPAEQALVAAYAKAHDALGDSPRDLATFAACATTLVDPINTFFDDILVMAEDPILRAARIGLLAGIRDLSSNVLDWSKLA